MVWLWNLIYCFPDCELQVNKCWANASLDGNGAWQWVHMKQEWTWRKWVFRWCFNLNLLSHNEQANVRPLWACMWKRRLAWLAMPLPQSSHLYGIRSPWSLDTCWRKSNVLMNPALQTMQWTLNERDELKTEDGHSDVCGFRLILSLSMWEEEFEYESKPDPRLRCFWWAAEMFLGSFPWCNAMTSP